MPGVRARAGSALLQHGDDHAGSDGDQCGQYSLTRREPGDVACLHRVEIVLELDPNARSSSLTEPISAAVPTSARHVPQLDVCPGWDSNPHVLSDKEV